MGVVWDVEVEVGVGRGGGGGNRLDGVQLQHMREYRS